MPTKDNSNLKNIHKEPLHAYTIFANGRFRQIPALDIYWAPRSIFANYTSWCGRMKNDAALQQWQHDAENFKTDMEFLLSLPHNVFWSYIIFRKSALASVVSFLSRATPFYYNICMVEPDGNIPELYEQILNLVLRILCRILTQKESPDAWIEKDHFRKLIYKNYLISVPMLFDLLVAIGDASKENAKILSKVFETLLNIEPNYQQDIKAALNYFPTVFRSIHTQTENEGCEGAGGGLPDETTETPFDDVALYTVDCAFTLAVFLEICPKDLKLFCIEQKLGQSIANFYDNTLPFLYKNIYVINDQAQSLVWLNQARLQLLRAFRSISYYFVDAVITKPELSLQNSENFIALLTECLNQQTFVIDYERHYSVSLDMEILKQACKELDEFKADFIEQGYRREAQDSALASIDGINDLVSNIKLNETKTSKQKVKKNSVTNGCHKDTAVTALPPEKDLDLDVSVVLDCLPHLGTGFIRRLLSRYENTEEVIAAVLENNLPPDLAQADQTEMYIPPDPQDQIYKQTGLQHFNVYDGDKYDIMTQDKPQCIIKKGKGFPNAPQNASQLLDDKKDLSAIRHRYQEFTLVAEDDSEDGDKEYNDEYDDSYEALLESETRVVKKTKDMKQILANIGDDEESEEESDNSGDEKTNDDRSKQRYTNFCENPEDIRARYEANRQAKWANKKGGNTQYTPPKNDVVGRAKGQGQEKDVLRSRQNKEANKSARANHNRKKGADFKRSKGMF